MGTIRGKGVKARRMGRSDTFGQRREPHTGGEVARARRAQHEHPSTSTTASTSTTTSATTARGGA